MPKMVKPGRPAVGEIAEQPSSSPVNSAVTVMLKTTSTGCMR
jgi:hypothetical protein